MDGYKIVYREPNGAIRDTFFSELMSSFSMPKSSNKDNVVKLMFRNAYPNCKIISIERCTLGEFTK